LTVAPYASLVTKHLLNDTEATMRRKILMGLLAFGVVAGFGSEIRRAAWRHGSCGSSCADYEQKSNESSAVPSVESQASQSNHKKGEHCDGWKGRWNWGGEQTEKAPETPVTTAQNQ
jgi:hypothetical protein